MDIAKIRKKAQEKEKEGRPEEMPDEKKAAEEKEEELSREPVAEVKEEEEGLSDEQVPDEEAEPLKPASSECLPVSRVSEADIVSEDGEVEMLAFRLGSEEFAFRVRDVEEIVKYQSITRVPTMPDYLLGITSLRGKIIPVIDLKSRLGLKKSSAAGYADKEGRIAAAENNFQKILIISGPKGLIGATIDRVVGVARFDAGKILDPPAHLAEAELRFIEGVVVFEKRFMSVIRAEDTMNIELS